MNAYDFKLATLDNDSNKSISYKKQTTSCFNRSKCYICAVVVLFIIFGIGILGWWFLITSNDLQKIEPPQPSPSYASNFTSCGIKQSNGVRPYPDPLRKTYLLSFNQTIMQAEYVKYINPFVKSSDKSCNYLKKDPYDINVLRYTDYTNTGYDRGHLVPNIDYGNDTCIISNVVPQLSQFNKGSWKQNEIMIRNKYKGKLVFKGCEYSDKYVMTGQNNKLYIPVGCSYVVFDSENMDQVSDLILLDYGYLENKITSAIIKKLPEWVVCTLKNKSTY